MSSSSNSKAAMKGNPLSSIQSTADEFLEVTNMLPQGATHQLLTAGFDSNLHEVEGRSGHHLELFLRKLLKQLVGKLP